MEKLEDMGASVSCLNFDFTSRVANQDDVRRLAKEHFGHHINEAAFEHMMSSVVTSFNSNGMSDDATNVKY